MIGTYFSFALILGASALVGQAGLAACGRRQWSALAPTIGLGLVCAVAWGAAHVTGSATAGLLAVAAVTLVSATGLWLERPVGSVPSAGAVTVGAIVLGSVPFWVEMRFGILGTGLNPDMSQHLFAADRLLSGGEERLVSTGYPLGPHALVGSVSKLGPSLVEGFGGLALAVAVATSLAPLALLDRLKPARRVVAALFVGFAYLAASALIQGSFKESMEAMFFLVFAIAAALSSASLLGGLDPASRWARLGAVPFALIAVGAIYSYSFPGLVWLGGFLGVWALAELVRRRSTAPLQGAVRVAVPAAAVFVIAIAAEVPRLADFASFETFDPDGPGLGNLFNPISPLESLGIWPSGDFRLDPGSGIAPAVVFYAGGALALLFLALGLRRLIRGGDVVLPSAVVAGAALYLFAFVAGTPYQEAKALAIVAPVVALISIGAAMRLTPRMAKLRDAGPRALVAPLAAAAFVLAATGSSALALVNGPVGPSEWTPALTEFNAELEPEEVTLAVVDDEYIAENGYDLVVWELRGREACVISSDDVGAANVANRAFDAVVLIGELESPLPVVGRLDEVASDGDYALYRAELSGEEPNCPFVADGDRAEPGE